MQVWFGFALIACNTQGASDAITGVCDAGYGKHLCWLRTSTCSQASIMSCSQISWAKATRSHLLLPLLPLKYPSIRSRTPSAAWVLCASTAGLLLGWSPGTHTLCMSPMTIMLCMPTLAHRAQHLLSQSCLLRSSDHVYCWEEFVGNTMTQYSPDGELLFLHTNLSPKWNLQIPGDFKAYTRRQAP